jgi:hypothetical protein
VPHVAQLQQSKEHTCQYGPMLTKLELGAKPVTIGREAEMYSGQYCSGQTHGKSLGCALRGPK